MRTIIGLGNPRREYELTRHNAGRIIVTELAGKNFEESNKYLSLIKTFELCRKEEVLFALPETFMNKSGRAITALKAKPKKMVVIHDDSDIPLGIVKISISKRSAGHKGVESVMRAVKSKDFFRIRVGIQKKKHVPAEKLVLQKFKPNELKTIKKLVPRIKEELCRDKMRATTIRT